MNENNNNNRKNLSWVHSSKSAGNSNQIEYFIKLKRHDTVPWCFFLSSHIFFFGCVCEFENWTKYKYELSIGTTLEMIRFLLLFFEAILIEYISFFSFLFVFIFLCNVSIGRVWEWCCFIGEGYCCLKWFVCLVNLILLYVLNQFQVVFFILLTDISRITKQWKNSINWGYIADSFLNFSSSKKTEMRKRRREKKMAEKPLKNEKKVRGRGRTYIEKVDEKCQTDYINWKK